MAQEGQQEGREDQALSMEEAEVRAGRESGAEGEQRQPPPAEPAQGGLLARLRSLFRRG